jgi:hypothetical protein
MKQKVLFGFLLRIVQTVLELGISVLTRDERDDVPLCGL